MNTTPYYYYSYFVGFLKRQEFNVVDCFAQVIKDMLLWINVQLSQCSD